MSSQTRHTVRRTVPNGTTLPAGTTSITSQRPPCRPPVASRGARLCSCRRWQTSPSLSLVRTTTSDPSGGPPRRWNSGRFRLSEGLRERTRARDDRYDDSRLPFENNDTVWLAEGRSCCAPSASRPAPCWSPLPSSDGEPSSAPPAQPIPRWRSPSQDGPRHAPLGDHRADLVDQPIR